MGAVLLALMVGAGCSPTKAGSGHSSSGSSSGSGSGSTGQAFSGSSSGGHGSTSGSTGSGTSGTTGVPDGGCGLQTCASVGANCGQISDGCGNLLDCGSCIPPQSCGGDGTPSVCGGNTGCVPRTCASVGATCGPVADGCGNLLDCDSVSGGCQAPESCGGGGTPNVCGTSTVVDGGLLGPDGGCQPRGCAAQGINCGPAGDGCGGQLNCDLVSGGCQLPAICGGAGTPSVCGVPSTSCTPATCASLGYNCGYAADGCGQLLNCDSVSGGCTQPQTCGGGGQPNICGSLSGNGTLQISPGSTPLLVQNGAAATVQLTALYVSGGSSQAVNANWSSSRPDLASVDQSGLVSASGPEGGSVTITAGYLGLLATAQVTVSVNRAVCSPDCGTAPPGAFGAAPGSGQPQAPTLLYPYDQTVIPVNLQPLNFQWQPGSGNDLFQLNITGSQGSLSATIAPADPSHSSYTFDPSVWAPFAHAHVGQTVTVSLLGASSGAPGTVWAAANQSLKLASSRMAGSIYYWAVSTGQILNIPAGGNSATPVYSPPTSPASYGGGGTQCIACHSVSPDGTKLSAELWGGGGPGTVVSLAGGGASPLVSPNPPDDWPNSPVWDFSTFDDTGLLLVTSHSGNFTLRSSLDGSPVPAGSGEGNLSTLGCGPGSTCAHPVWSRDGHYLVYAQALPGYFGAGWDFTASNLMLSQWIAGSESFTSPSTVVQSDYDGTVMANAYPTISVDDALVAFTRSICSYADRDPCAHSSSLAVVPASGGTPVALTQAETVHDGSVETSARYPNFSPFKEGGYHWMAFFSMRDYGWVAQGRRQIWVTAIDDSPSPGADPSHPAFWLPGQDFNTENDKAEWATLPCVGQGQACQGDIDCCGSGSALVCQYANGASTCQPPQAGCGFWGSACSSSADCCSPAQCELGVCCTPLTCGQLGLNCGPAGDGCGGTLDCGTCNTGSCGGGGVPGQCGGGGCTPRTCAQLGLNCGPAGDGCGGPLDCGTCTSGTCGGNGVPGQCGTGSVCHPLSCADQGLACGPAGDGCGHVLDCGSCPSGQVCGGAGTPGACGQTPCVPQTCQGLGYNCGDAADGCGAVIHCGHCTGSDTCGGGGQANVCGSHFR